MEIKVPMKRLILLTILILFSVLALPATVKAESENSTYITSARVNFRVSGSLEAEIFKIIPYGYELNVLYFDPDGWTRVQIYDLVGYVNSEFIIIVCDEEPVVEPVIDEMPIIDEVPVQAPPDEAPVIAQPSLEDITYITSARVNFRANGSFDGYIFEVLPAGLILDNISYEPNGWSRVTINGTDGYINSEFIIRRDFLAVGEARSVLASRVENVHWSELRETLPQLTPIEVLDLRSGLRYYVHSFSNGSHADVVPLTQQDTDIMLQTFGGRWEWTQRPVWVTVGGRTYAASINGMPHGGQTSIETNGMNGHICLHFLGSRPHNGNAAFERDNQNTVEEAWNARLR